MSSIKGNPASITWSHMRWSVGVWMKGIFKIIGFSKSLWQSPTWKIIKETKLSWAWRKVSFMDQKLVRKQKVWRWRTASTGPPGIHVHEDFIQYLHHRPGEKRNREISEPADETKSFWVAKWHNNGEEHQQKAKKPSGQGGGSWASLDKLKGNTYRDKNLNHDGDAELMGVTTSDLGSHHWQLSEIISSLCSGLQKKNQHKAVNHLEGYCERDRCCFATSQALGMSPSCMQSWSREGCSS